MGLAACIASTSLPCTPPPNQCTRIRCAARGGADEAVQTPWPQYQLLARVVGRGRCHSFPPPGPHPGAGRLLPTSSSSHCVFESMRTHQDRQPLCRRARLETPCAFLAVQSLHCSKTNVHNTRQSQARAVLRAARSLVERHLKHQGRHCSKWGSPRRRHVPAGPRLLLWFFSLVLLIYSSHAAPSIAGVGSSSRPRRNAARCSSLY